MKGPIRSKNRSEIMGKDQSGARIVRTKGKGPTRSKDRSETRGKDQSETRIDQGRKAMTSKKTEI